MPEIKRNVIPVKITYACDHCSIIPNSGCVLVATNKVFLTDIPSYEYKCPNCNKIYELKNSYPYIDFIEEYEVY